MDRFQKYGTFFGSQEDRERETAYRVIQVPFYRSYIFIQDKKEMLKDILRFFIELIKPFYLSFYDCFFCFLCFFDEKKVGENRRQKFEGEPEPEAYINNAISTGKYNAVTFIPKVRPQPYLLCC